MERVENTITQLESLKLVLDEKLHKIDQQRPENTLAKGEMSRRGLEWFNTPSLHNDLEEQLKMQHD